MAGIHYSPIRPSSFPFLLVTPRVAHAHQFHFGSIQIKLQSIKQILLHVSDRLQHMNTQFCILHHQPSLWLIAIWSTILWQNNNIVIVLSTMLSNLTILLPCMIILFHHMVRIFYNIVTMLSIFTILCNNIVIIYGNSIVKIENMVNNIVTILLTILSNLTTLLTIWLQYVDFIVINLGKVC